ncbi:hypothetical protein ccbrp13_27730 [Ktedonobacteria bacterium brp13]|nr:hypothetical protein ccbrp13_27730 [Ktedonobacteria bacterium brp13]
MEQLTRTSKKRLPMLPRTGTIVGIIAIVVAVILVLWSGPHEKEHDTLFGGEPTPPVVATGLLNQQAVKQQLTYKGVAVSFTQTQLATKFSDDGKTVGNVGKYTLRVMINTQNHNAGSTTIGVDYAHLIQIILPDGEKLSPKLVSIDAIEYPGRAQSGFVDFPVNQQVPLNGLKLQFAQQVVPLSQ